MTVASLLPAMQRQKAIITENQLLKKQVRQTAAQRSVGITGKRAVQISEVDGITAGSGVERLRIRDGNDGECSINIVRIQFLRKID